MQKRLLNRIVVKTVQGHYQNIKKSDTSKITIQISKHGGRAEFKTEDQLSIKVRQGLDKRSNSQKAKTGHTPKAILDNMPQNL